jgi:hypothetical protein
VFFVKHNLIGVRDQYANDGSDMIFYPEHFSAQGWTRSGLTVVETRAPQTGAVVTMTAMNCGAVGTAGARQVRGLRRQLATTADHRR